jgi:UDPglucose--hexose-1-phosphate uridylyltransferase
MSELRQDIVSGDWIIMAPERAKRPHDLLPKKKPRKPSPVSTCPFEDLTGSGNGPILLTRPNERAWKVAVIPNKYPALTHGSICATPFRSGPYVLEGGIGVHDLIVMRDHAKGFAHLPPSQALDVLGIAQERYRQLAKDSCIVYVSTFYNWGVTAGASLYHPHCQLLGLPIIPPDVAHSLNGSHRYYAAHRRCVHCEMLAFEKRARTRIIVQNRHAVSLAPFVSRDPFEVRVFPQTHRPFFEQTSERELVGIVAVLQKSLQRIERYLHDPDLNFFIHTAPLKRQAHQRHYHWHIEILPKVTIPAGFELGTGVEINVIDPDRAARILRGGTA